MKQCYLALAIVLVLSYARCGNGENDNSSEFDDVRFSSDCYYAEIVEDSINCSDCGQIVLHVKMNCDSCTEEVQQRIGPKISCILRVIVGGRPAPDPVGIGTLDFRSVISGTSDENDCPQYRIAFSNDLPSSLGDRVWCSFSSDCLVVDSGVATSYILHCEDSVLIHLVNP